MNPTDRPRAFKFFSNSSDSTEHPANAARVDVNEIFAVVILTATAFTSVKRRLLFQLYDLDDSGDLSLSEVVMLISSAIRGLCKATGGRRPNVQEEEAFCYAMFEDIDADADGRVTEAEWIAACQRNYVVVGVLARFCRKGEWAATRAKNARKANVNAPIKVSDPNAREKMHAPVRRRTTISSQALLRDIKREVRLLRETFDAIDEDHSGEITIDELLRMSSTAAGASSPARAVRRRRGSLTADNEKQYEVEKSECGRFHTVVVKPPKSSIPKHLIESFKKMDADGDGKITWEELISVMFASYGRAVVRDILSWPLHVVRKVGKGETNKTTEKVAIESGHAADLRQLFEVYDKRGRGDIPIFYLARRMSELHDLDEDDLLAIFEGAGQEPRDLVDADTFVELTKFLLSGDAGMLGVLELLKGRPRSINDKGLGSPEKR